VSSSGARPAFYALGSGGWRDYVTLLHAPYTAWHLSYVVIGAALAPRLQWGLLGWTTLAFLLALGIGAHALDELKGRPLQTKIPTSILVALAAISIGAACAIGLAVAADRTWWLAAFVAAGGFIVVAYNLELCGGAFHSDLWFAVAWGAFPLVTAYFASAERFRVEVIPAAGFAVATSLAQRMLSTHVRFARRQLGDASSAAAAETSLKLLCLALPLLAGALLLVRSG
jgi:hypothetical protein